MIGGHARWYWEVEGVTGLYLSNLDGISAFATLQMGS